MFLTKRNRTYYLRVRVPLDMVRYFGRGEIVKSLKTSNYKQARGLATGLLGKLQEVCTMARSGVLTDEMIQRICRQYLDQQVSLFDKGRNLEPTTLANSDWHERLCATTESDAGYEMYVKAMETIIRANKKTLGRGKSTENPIIQVAAESAIQHFKLGRGIVGTPE